MKLTLLILLVVFAVGFATVWLRSLLARSDGSRLRWPTWHQLTIGFVTNFFDTLGIGNFAPTTVWFRYSKMVPDERIPGTMNVGHTLPVVLMGLLFISIIEVEAVTLLTLIGAAVLGAWFGAGVVSALPKRAIQVGMGIALLAAVLAMVAGMRGLMPAGDDSLGLATPQLILAAIALAVLGALMTIGVGLYAPCMVVISLLGMNQKASFPIMMGACAFLMPVASSRFVLSGAYSARPATGLALGGLPAVLIAAFAVEKMSLDWLRWLVVVIVTYTAVMMLAAARRVPAAVPAVTDDDLADPGCGG